MATTDAENIRLLFDEMAAQSRRIANLEGLIIDYYKLLDRLVERMAQPEREAWLRRQLDGLGKDGG